jgi:hypothetical protein
MFGFCFFFQKAGMMVLHGKLEKSTFDRSFTLNISLQRLCWWRSELIG